MPPRKSLRKYRFAQWLVIALFLAGGVAYFLSRRGETSALVNAPQSGRYTGGSTLSAYWPFDGNDLDATFYLTKVLDRSGNSLDGIDIKGDKLYTSFATSGSHSFTPTYTIATIEAWGGGGGGGGQNLDSDGGGGGGGGAYARLNRFDVTPGASYSVSVGAGGTGGTGGAGTAGGDTYFIGTSTLLAKGGSPGSDSSGTPPAGGTGGSAASSVGDTVYSGGNGGAGKDNATGVGAPGGSSGGSAANGTSGPDPWTSAIPSPEPLGAGYGGKGGDAGVNGSSPVSGSGGGGGGSGEGTTKVGGNGAAGKVLVTEWKNRQTAGPVGQALDFNGTDDRVVVGNSLNIADSSDFSVTGWFNRDTANTEDTIVEKRVAQANSEATWTAAFDGSSGFIFLATDTTHDVVYAGSESNGILYRCDAATGCNEQSDYVSILDLSLTITGLIFDAQQGVIYMGTSNSGYIYRCDTSTGCDASGEWVVSYDSPETTIDTFTIDTTHDVLYAGSNFSGGIYRCDLSTSCDAAGDWTVSNSTSTNIYSLAFDSIHGVLYAGTGASGIIYRCDTSTSCDADVDWTTSYDSPVSYIYSLAFDAVHGALYAGTGDTGIIYRCDTGTSCDAAGDWASAYDSTNQRFFALVIDEAGQKIYGGTQTSGFIFSCELASGCMSSSDWIAGPIILGGTSAASLDNITSFSIDTTNGILYAGASSNVIYRCDLASGCSLSNSWVTAYDSPGTTVDSMGVDSTHSILYAGTGNGGIIYRCDTANGCDAPGNWTTSYDTPQTGIESFVFDSTHGILYAGTGSGGIIYRCDTANGCDVPGNWTTSYDTPQTGIESFVFDSTHGILYAGTGASGIIYRCDTTTNCDAAGDWTTSYDTTELYIYTMVFDAANNVLYAGTGNGGIIYRCDTTTNCDAAGDWTTSYDTSSTSIYSSTNDTVHGVLYAGSSNSATIYRCELSTGCDASGDWTAVSSSLGYTYYAMTFDVYSSSLFLADSNARVFRCDTSSSCDQASDWRLSTYGAGGTIYSLAYDPTNHVVYAGQGNNGIIYAHYDDLSLGYRLYLDDADDKLHLSVSDPTSTYDIASTSTFTSPGWHSFAAVFSDSDANAGKIYIDGADDTGTKTGTLSYIGSLTNTGNFTIGASSNEQNFFDGKLDEVRVYSSALSSTPATELERPGFLRANANQKSMMTTNLAGLWTFNGPDTNFSLNSTEDGTSGNKDGTLSGFTAASAVPGKSGQALDFDGSTSRISMGDNFDISDGVSFSLSGWFSRGTFSTDHTIVAKQKTPTSGDAGYTLFIDDTDDTIHFFASDGSNTFSMNSNTAIANSDWKFFTVVFDESNPNASKIYINGVDDTSSVVSSGTLGDLSNAKDFIIGAESDLAHFFDGKLDEIRIYTSALSESEVVDLYSTASGYKRSVPGL